MSLVHSLATTYRWSYDEIMQRTLPQIIMLNHAAWKAQAQGEANYEAKKEWEKDHKPVEKVNVPEFTSAAQMNAYMGDWSGFQ